MSFRALHHTKAAKQIDAAESLVDLAELERQELEGGEHRASLVDGFRDRAKALSADITEDQHLRVLEILDGKAAASIILAALEGDSHSDDDTGPGETREGGESPSEAEPTPRPQPQRKAEAHSRRFVGRMVRVRQSDGGHVFMGLADARRRR